jgi:hypothetical protein
MYNGKQEISYVLQVQVEEHRSIKQVLQVTARSCLDIIKGIQKL